MRLSLCIALIAAVGCSSSELSPDAGVMIDAGRVDAAAGTLGPEHGTYTLDWVCDGGCLGGAPFEYFDELSINRDASPIELTYRQLECGTACDYVDTATVSDPCVDGTGIDLGDGSKSDAYSFCPDRGGPSAVIKYRGFPGPDVEKTWFGHAEPVDTP